MKTGIYRHFKGGEYYVIGLAEHTETCEEMVIYVPLQAPAKGPLMQARPRKIWDKPVNGKPRFVFLHPQEGWK